MREKRGRSRGGSIPTHQERTPPSRGLELLEGVRRAEERLRLAFERGNTFAYEWNADTGMVALCGDCDAILGFSAGSLITQQQILSKIFPEDMERLTVAF